MRYDKYADNYLAAVKLVCVKLWCQPQLSRRPNRFPYTPR